MEGKKRKRQQQEDQEQTGHTKNDVEMEQETTSIESEQRKIVKIKKRVQQQTDKIIEEDGEEIELGEELEYEQEDIVQRDDDDDNDGWEDEDSDQDNNQAKMEEVKNMIQQNTKSKGKKKEVWDPVKEPLQEGEELVFDNSAYEMLHRAKVEWPCLSIDFLLKDRIGSQDQSWFPNYLDNLNPQHEFTDKKGITRHRQDKFPYNVYLCAGSQASKKNENKIYVMKWTNMQKTLKDDDPDSQEEEGDQEDDDDKIDPEMRFQVVPHKGSVNRIRSMYGTGIVATWNDEAEVGIYNVTQAVDALDQQIDGDKKQKQKTFGGTKIASFKNKDEGFALDWSPFTFGRLAAGSCSSHIQLYQAADQGCSTFVKEHQVGLQGHKGSVEDVQFSPSQEHVLASCSTDQTIKLWDLRATQMKSQMSFRAHDCDVNVISWNTTSKFLLASGDDKGEFKVWDLRMLQQLKGKEQLESITKIRWHTAPITSIQFEPREDSVLAVSSADNRLTLWDFSVEVDEQSNDQDNDIPPQLMFLHQGQDNMKELRFHPYYRTMIVTTAEDSYNIFRPNLEPDDDLVQEEESKDNSKVKGALYQIDSENEEEEEERMIRAAKKLNRDRQSKSKNKEAKRRKVEDDQ